MKSFFKEYNEKILLFIFIALFILVLFLTYKLFSLDKKNKIDSKITMSLINKGNVSNFTINLYEFNNNEYIFKVRNISDNKLKTRYKIVANTNNDKLKYNIVKYNDNNNILNNNESSLMYLNDKEDVFIIKFIEKKDIKKGDYLNIIISEEENENN